MHFTIAFVVVAYSSKVVIVAIATHQHHHPQAYQLNGLAITITSQPFIIMADDTKVAISVAVIEEINCLNAGYVKVVITTASSSH